MTDRFLRGFLREGAWFWERGRLIYNAVLLALTMVVLAYRWPDAHYFFHEHFAEFWSDALIANALYCAAYLLEPFLRLASNRIRAHAARLAVLCVGTAFACLLAYGALVAILLEQPWAD